LKGLHILEEVLSVSLLNAEFLELFDLLLIFHVDEALRELCCGLILNTLLKEAIQLVGQACSFFPHLLLLRRGQLLFKRCLLFNRRVTSITIAAIVGMSSILKRLLRSMDISLMLELVLIVLVSQVLNSLDG